MRQKVRRKYVWDDSGVSEIIADILILAMTVVLFAIIFAFVWSLPAPDEAVYADFDTNIDLNDSGGGIINVTHISGEDITNAYTDIVIIKNKGSIGQDYRSRKVNGPSGEDSDNPLGYGINDDTWSTGEVWTYYHGSVSSSDDLEVIIIDTKTNSLVFGAKLLGAGVNDAPIIMERWYTPKPGVNASTLTLYANVRDPDGFEDINSMGSVYADVSALNSTFTYVDLEIESSTDFTGTFKKEITVDKGQGDYTLTFNAEDTSGAIDRGRMDVAISLTALHTPKILERWSIPEVGINGSEITVYARVEDEDGYNNLDYVTIDIGALENANGSSNIVNMSDPEGDGIFEYGTTVNVLRGDAYRVNFTAMDITGLFATAHLNITVNKFNPLISRTWTVPTTGMDDEFITIYAEVFDPDGYSDIKQVQIDPSNLDPALGWMNMTDPDQDGIFETNLTINISTGGNKTVSFLASDQMDNTDSASMKVFIATRNPPVILERWTNPNFIDNDTFVSIFARVMDPDGYDDLDTVTVNISALNRTLNGSSALMNMVDYNQDGNFINITLVDQEAGAYVINFQATDKGGNTANATLNLTILPYRPRFLNVWTNPVVGKNGSEIQIFANIMDPNGYFDIANVTLDIVELNQSLNQSIPFWVNMTDLNQNGTFNFITTINVDETDIYSLNFTVTDQSGNQETTNHQLLVTSNRPTIVQAWYTPTPAVNGTNVTVYAWVSDDDGYSDIVSVAINVSELSINETWLNMTDADENSIFETTFFIDNINVSGTYNVTIVVNDTTENIFEKNLEVDVVMAAGEGEQGPTVFGMLTPNGVSSGGQVFISALAINGSKSEDMIVKLTFELLDGSDLFWPAGNPSGEVEMERVFENLFFDPEFSTGRLAPYANRYNEVVSVRFRAYNASTTTPPYQIAEQTVTLLVIWDKSGGKVTEGTALEQNVAWISGDQGYVITNNKSTPDPHQIFDVSDDEDEIVWVKIGSNVITNTEKANIFRLHSRTFDVDVSPYSSLEFEYDGVLAGYWFFVLNFSAKELYNGWMNDNGLTSEYFDVYMKIKDSTDDFFATNAWVVVHGGSIDFYAEVIPYFDPNYTPGSSSWDPANPTFPAGLMRADNDTPLDIDDDHFFNSTERLYLRIIVETPGDTSPTANANQIELVDFIGNRPISNAPGVGPVSIVKTNPALGGDYMIVVDLIRADKDPWVIGESAYTVFIRDFVDSNENYDFMAAHFLVNSPTSILDVVSGMPSQTSTTRDNFLGFYYENIGIFDSDPYEIIPGGADDDVEAVWSVAFADLDNDEKKDVVAATQAGYLYLYQNNGFWTRQTLDTVSGTAFTNVYSGDVDDDGDDDIVAGDSNGNVYYYENDGSWDGAPDQTLTGFGAIGDTSKTQADADIGDHALALTDLDNDSDLDLIIGGANGLYYALFDTSTKQFGSSTNIDGNSAFCVAVGDINQDGFNDVAYSDNDNGGGYDIFVILNDGVGAPFDGSSVDLAVNNFAARASIAVGNLDGSGWLELVVGRTSFNVYDHTTGSWALASNQPSGYTSGDHGEITSMVVANVDGAIEDDIVIATAGITGGTDDGGFIFYFRNMGQGSEYLLMQPPVANLKQDIGTPQEICTITVGDADEGLA
jgi:FlaG/FlaF family flagellin (archaellin)